MVCLLFWFIQLGLFDSISNRWRQRENSWPTWGYLIFVYEERCVFVWKVEGYRSDCVFSTVLWDACSLYVYRCGPSPLFSFRPPLRKSDTLWFKQTDGLSTEMVQLLGGEVLRNQMPPQHTRGECNFLLTLKKTKTKNPPCPSALSVTIDFYHHLDPPRIRRSSAEENVFFLFSFIRMTNAQGAQKTILKSVTFFCTDFGEGKSVEWMWIW